MAQFGFQLSVYRGTPGSRKGSMTRDQLVSIMAAIIDSADPTDGEECLTVQQLVGRAEKILDEVERRQNGHANFGVRE
jgi:hypothetical protein